MAELSTQNNNCRSAAPVRRTMAPKIDMTPMVDLMFLLITFFMLTTTLAKQHAMALAMPVGNDPGAVADNRTMTICLGNKNMIQWYMGNENEPLNRPATLSFDNGELRKTFARQKLAVRRNTGKDLIVIIKPGEKSKYKNLIDALDELKIQGLDTYSIVSLSGQDARRMKEEHIY